MDFSGIEFKRFDTMTYEGEEYKDAIFNVRGQSQTDLTKYYMQQGMQGIGCIRYGLDDKTIGIQCVFPFNFYYIAYDIRNPEIDPNIAIPEGLREYLENVVKQLEVN